MNFETNGDKGNASQDNGIPLDETSAHDGVQGQYAPKNEPSK